jgi:hypothetical protein
MSHAMVKVANEILDAHPSADYHRLLQVLTRRKSPYTALLGVVPMTGGSIRVFKNKGKFAWRAVEEKS